MLVVEEREEKVAIDGGYKTIWVFSLLFGRKRGGGSARGAGVGKGRGEQAGVGNGRDRLRKAKARSLIGWSSVRVRGSIRQRGGRAEAAKRRWSNPTRANVIAHF